MTDTTKAPADAVPAGSGDGVPTPDGAAPARPEEPEEFGGRDGPDPTRYGDWEKNGRCIDF